MSIRPMDLQVMVPRLSEVSRLSQLQQERGSIDQQQIASTLGKEQEKEKRGIVQPKEQEKMHNHADAKEKGSNGYHQDKKRKNSEKEKSEEKQQSIYKIDVRI